MAIPDQAFQGEGFDAYWDRFATVRQHDDPQAAVISGPLTRSSMLARGFKAGTA